MNALRLMGAVIGMLIAFALVPEPTPDVPPTDLSLAALEIAPGSASVGLLAATAEIQTTRPTGYIGRDVKSPDGSIIGHITDVVLDANGQATHVIVVPGLTVGSDAAPVAVPWSSVMGMDEADSSVVISPVIREASPLPAPEPEAPAST
jgi:sporulation protein YlmC with PRC-barrel domain